MPLNEIFQNQKQIIKIKTFLIKNQKILKDFDQNWHKYINLKSFGQKFKKVIFCLFLAYRIWLHGPNSKRQKVLCTKFQGLSYDTHIICIPKKKSGGQFRVPF